MKPLSVGKPMDIPKLPNPTNEEVDVYHAKFVKHLQEMFEEQKYNYVDEPEKTQLVIE